MERAELSTLLRQRRAELLARGAAGAAPLPRPGGADAAMADPACAAQLAQVEAALGRMDAGVYGICAGCGVCLTREYLLADPTAMLCARCSLAQRGGT
jgi:hypothetical protein